MSRGDSGSRSGAHKVLVIADSDDGEATLVAAALETEAVVPVWVDTADFPDRLGLTVAVEKGQTYTHVVLQDGTAVDLGAIRAVYRRSPSTFGLDEHMSGPERRFALMEAVHGVGGAFATMRCIWMNHPARVADATYKPHQLAIAGRCGLTAPRTVVTNREQVARAFLADAPGRVIYKPMSPGVISESDSVKVINASIVDPDLPDDTGIDKTSHLFQDFIEKRYDVRVTAVGATCIAVAIETDDELAKIDWRANYDALGYRRIDTPPIIRAGIVRYLDAFDLTFAAFDFTVDTDGSWWFLEANPNGLWAWIELEAGTDVASTIARYLSTELQR